MSDQGTDNEMSGIEKILKAAFRGEKDKFAGFMKAAKTGDMAALDTYLFVHAGCEKIHLGDDKQKLLNALFDAPQDFAKPLPVFHKMASSMSLDDFFEKQGPSFEQKIWSAYAAQPTPDVAQMAGVMMADYLRFKILRDFTFEPSLTILNDELTCAKSLTQESQDITLRNAVLAVQNALVDVVQSDGAVTPLHRGVGMLPILKGDVPSHVAKIWTEKMTDFKVSQGYSVQQGDIIKVSPVYGCDL